MIPVMGPLIDAAEIDRVLDCLHSGWISSQGQYIPAFEKAFAEFCGTWSGVATSNGTTALHLALLTLGIGPGDEVIVPTLSFAATANVVIHAGAKPIFVDVEEATWTIDPQQIEPALSERTKAVIPVHLYGHPAPMDPILALAEKYRLWVVEDAAEAHGAEYRGRRVGSLGHLGCFSFYGNKIITTGEGGMIVTGNPEWAEKARMLRDHGMSRERKYWHPLVGYNYRMTNIQAAIGLGQMTKINDILEKKRRLAERYHYGFQGLAGVTPPPEASWARNVFWLYSILLSPENGKERDDLIRFLYQAGVDSRPLFYPIHVMPPYQGPGPFPVAERLSNCGISLPSGADLTFDQIDRIVSLIREFVSR
ncbi:MAG: DegT/DnrJ/EryC1/StrS family aminotransferase [Deltaproteobacteria bacterium]|nr:DegT/DnrJ/EryC1/StrS family aminotransferase [Deltaproteobacteria bacterium]